ncbi:MarR family transcriptional regulator, partial [Nocardia higoensis]|uniref:MarR family transcriptional regulator n=1 Tax=Nocardia higoensis TaxID=228599 RepID=UPI001FE097A9
MSGDLAVELRRLEQEGSTGVLLAGDGEFHLADGAIASAHCHRATGLDRLVVEAGVATPEDWRRAGAGDPSGVLDQPQLETLALLSVYDAAYFLLSSGAEPEFRPAPAHWLSRVCHVRPRELVRECERRGDPGSGPWPAELVDRAPVVPARRVHRRRVMLTAGQAEVLAAADARRSVTEIARYLGRTTYGCLTAVRELTVSGLIEPAAGVDDSPGIAPDDPERASSSRAGVPALPGPTPATGPV